MTRREFLTFFVLGGFLSAFWEKLSSKKIELEKEQKEAMFWRKADEA